MTVVGESGWEGARAPFLRDIVPLPGEAEG